MVCPHTIMALGYWKRPASSQYWFRVALQAQSKFVLECLADPVRNWNTPSENISRNQQLVFASYPYLLAYL